MKCAHQKSNENKHHTPIANFDLGRHWMQGRLKLNIIWPQSTDYKFPLY